MVRTLVLIYGLACYAVFLAVAVYAIGFIGGFGTPTQLDGVPVRPFWQALGIDLALLLVFALQHSGMARPAFKRWWTRRLAEPLERSTYVLLSSLALIVLFVLWEPIGGVIWTAPEGPARWLLMAIYLLGWAVLFYATFLIDHFDLFGLRQVWFRFRAQPYRRPEFCERGFYRLVRHPINVGWLIIFWAAPTMTVAHLAFALATTAYILVAIALEERDLMDALGDDYVQYRRRTPMLLPRLRLPRGVRALPSR